MLGLHVLNAGKGESVVLELPGHRWGVVDCYAPTPDDPETNPTTRFLSERGVGELEFLCLTHPHDDHYRGMSDLIRRFPPKQFWRSAAMTPPHLYGYCLDALGSCGDARYAQQSATDYWKLLDHVRTLRASGLEERPVCGPMPLYPPQVSITPSAAPAEVSIWAVGPPPGQVGLYQDGLARCFDAQGRVRFDRSQPNPNNVSVALLVIYGETRILLGGDLEQEGWSEVLTNLRDPAEELPSHVVKVSHHGSSNGYCDGLWTILAGRGKPVSVITPYWKSKLPSREGLEEIRRHSRRVFTTCGPAIREEAQTFAFWQGFPRDVDFFIRNQFGAFRQRGSWPSGIVSLQFDSHGRCVAENCTGAAAVMYDDHAPPPEAPAGHEA